ncbi:MAG: permease-like cell division protein FtsX [Acidobacteriota bacterium]|nr:permease-like cell division protein FtsX [Acidobacteriota bacterium]
MTFFQALSHFLREAGLNLVRGWRVSILAVVTIAASLYVGGVFLILSHGISSSVENWRGEARVVAYLEAETTAVRVEEIRRRVESASWVIGVETISSAEASDRFSETFPEISDLVASQGEAALPPSLEISLAPDRVEPPVLQDWLEQLAEFPEVAMVDDDRRWLAQVDVFASLLRLLGLVLGVVLLGAAVFTTATVIRLTAHVYRREIAVQRLVGGTEFYIRGPFVIEGVLQGLLGGILSAMAIGFSFSLLAARGPAQLAGGLFALEPLSWRLLVQVVAVGAAAGLLGALLSLRREI